MGQLRHFLNCLIVCCVDFEMSHSHNEVLCATGLHFRWKSSLRAWLANLQRVTQCSSALTLWLVEQSLNLRTACCALLLSPECLSLVMGLDHQLQAYAAIPLPFCHVCGVSY